MSNNWKTPKSETMLRCEALMEKHVLELRAENPGLDDEDTLTEMLLAIPEVAAALDQVGEELVRRRVEDLLDQDCFVYHVNGNKLIILDDELLKMSDRKLAAWARENGVMFAQLKAHLAERFPKTEGSA